MTLRPHLLSAVAMALLVLLAFGSVDEQEVKDAIDEAKREAESAAPAPAARPPVPAASSPSPPPASPARASDGNAVLRELFMGNLSSDQRDALFARSYRNQPIGVSGQITDVGTWFGSKYLTVQVQMGHLVDIFPAADFDLLDYRVGGSVRFEGTFTRLGTGAMIHHRVEKARDLQR